LPQLRRLPSLGAAVSAFTAEDEKSCHGSTYKIVECQKAKPANLDKRLSAAYQEALKQAECDKQCEQLRKTQRLWLQYREADCEYYELRGGTIARIYGGVHARSHAHACGRVRLGRKAIGLMAV
jgi:uncharacterized protein YecT (DUF1311 family)